MGASTKEKPNLRLAIGGSNSKDPSHRASETDEAVSMQAAAAVLASPLTSPLPGGIMGTARVDADGNRQRQPSALALDSESYSVESVEEY